MKRYRAKATATEDVPVPHDVFDVIIEDTSHTHSERKRHTAFLRKYLGRSKRGSKVQMCSALPPSLLIWGPMNSGKSYIVRNCLAESRIKIVIHVNCIEVIFGLDFIIQQFVRQLAKFTSINICRTERPRKSLDIFVQRILPVMDSFDSEPILIIVDRVELLRGEHDRFLRTLLDLTKFTTANVSCIFISRLPWRCLSEEEWTPPLQLHFPQYTRDETLDVVTSFSRLASDDVRSNVLTFYIKMVLTTHYATCRDIQILRLLIEKRMNAFLPPLECQQQDSKKFSTLWKRVLPLVRADYDQPNGLDVLKRLTQLSLPLTMTFLKISSFIMCHNPTSTDTQFFLKCRLKKQRNQSQQKADTEVFARSGDKQCRFRVSRLIGIFSSISNSKEATTLLILQCMKRLCELGFISIVDSSLDEPMYQSHVTYEAASELCNDSGVTFNLDAYLMYPT